MDQNKRRCSFCGEKRVLTLEHVLPDWLAGVFPRKGNVTNEFIGDEIKKWESKTFQHKVRMACAQCNNGWMSELESRVKPLFKKLIALDQTTIESDDQGTLSLWVQKTILMLNQATPGGIKVTEDLYRDIYFNKTASKKALVNLGWRMKYDVQLTVKGNTLQGFLMRS
jgi:hypothetical protein